MHATHVGEYLLLLFCRPLPAVASSGAKRQMDIFVCMFVLFYFVFSQGAQHMLPVDFQLLGGTMRKSFANINIFNFLIYFYFVLHTYVYMYSPAPSFGIVRVCLKWNQFHTPLSMQSKL